MVIYVPAEGSYRTRIVSLSMRGNVTTNVSPSYVARVGGSCSVSFVCLFELGEGSLDCGFGLNYSEKCALYLRDVTFNVTSLANDAKLNR